MSEETGEHNFFILAVDDNQMALNKQFQRSEFYLKEKNFKLIKIPDETGTNVIATLQQKHVDIVIIDENLPEVSGIELLKQIRDLNDLTDVLYYSADQSNISIFRDARSINFTEVVEGRDIANTLEKMVIKNFEKLDDIIILRGTIISKAIDLEIKINKFFELYFQIPDTKNEYFHNLLLEGTAMSFQGKKEALQGIINKEKIEGYGTFLDILSKIQGKRNKLAHCKAHPDKTGFLINLGEPKDFTRGELVELFQMIKESSTKMDELISKIS